MMLQRHNGLGLLCRGSALFCNRVFMPSLAAMLHTTGIATPWVMSTTLVLIDFTIYDPRVRASPKYQLDLLSLHAWVALSYLRYLSSTNDLQDSISTLFPLLTSPLFDPPLLSTFPPPSWTLYELHSFPSNLVCPSPIYAFCLLSKSFLPPPLVPSYSLYIPLLPPSYPIYPFLFTLLSYPLFYLTPSPVPFFSFLSTLLS